MCWWRYSKENDIMTSGLFRDQSLNHRRIMRLTDFPIAKLKTRMFKKGQLLYLALLSDFDDAFLRYGNLHLKILNDDTARLRAH